MIRRISIFAARRLLSRHASSSAMEKFGCHRSVDPLMSFPQSAETVNPESRLMSEDEGLLDVIEVLLDSTSMLRYRQISNTPTGTSERLQKTIEDVIRTRGKSHSSYTNSGGVMIGKMKSKGAKFALGTNKDVKIGDLVSPTASCSAIPLKIDRISNIEGNRIFVQGGIAVVFSCMELVVIPEDLGKDLALVCVDIASLIPQVRRTLQEIVDKNMAAGQYKARVMTVGCGVAGLAAIHTYAEVLEATHQYQKSLPNGHPAHFNNNPFRLESFAIDNSQANADRIASIGFDKSLFSLSVGDARDASVFASIVGESCDLVVNVVNIPDTETATVYCAKPNNKGVVFWFSMATRFDKAALGTDAVGKDVRMIVGNGIADGQIAETFALIRKYPKLRQYFENH